MRFSILALQEASSGSIGPYFIVTTVHIHNNTPVMTHLSNSGLPTTSVSNSLMIIFDTVFVENSTKAVFCYSKFGCTRFHAQNQ